MKEPCVSWHSPWSKTGQNQKATARSKGITQQMRPVAKLRFAIYRTAYCKEYFQVEGYKDSYDVMALYKYVLLLFFYFIPQVV